MRTSNWIKKLSGHAGELYVCAELSKRGIPNALLPENFSGDDILVGDKAGTQIAFIQVKACHPDRSRTFILKETHENWCSAPINQFCIFVWLGRPSQFEPLKYWIAMKHEVGKACIDHGAHGTKNWERRFHPSDFPKEWENRWSLFAKFQPGELSPAGPSAGVLPATGAQVIAPAGPAKKEVNPAYTAPKQLPQ